MNKLTLNQISKTVEDFTYRWLNFQFVLLSGTWKCQRCTDNDSQIQKRIDFQQRRDSSRSVSSSTIDVQVTSTALPYDVRC